MTKEWLFIIVGLAVFRLAILTSRDIGPFAIFDKARLYILSLILERGKAAAERYYWVIDGAHCAYCHSVWYAAVGALILQPADLIQYFVYWLGLAGFALICIGVSGNDKTGRD